MDETELAREFKARGPWTTRFVIAGRRYGGEYDPSGDPRLEHFFKSFPGARSVLELGALEGGHTFALARRAEQVVAIEGRADNLQRARFVQSLLGVANCEFIQGNLEHPEQIALPRATFDAVFCVGVLYHLPRPWELLHWLRRLSGQLLVWTQVPHRDGPGPAGYRGEMFNEISWQHPWLSRNPLAGLSVRSFWPTLDSLEQMLHDSGYSEVQVLETGANSNGPWVTLAARPELLRHVAECGATG